MARFAQERRVFYWEEPLFEADAPRIDVAVCPKTGVTIATPNLPQSMRGEAEKHLPGLLETFAQINNIESPIAWFYTPMALNWLPTSLMPTLVIYDCMDELSLFRGAPPELHRNEAHLFDKASLVFTGGVSLFEAKRSLHRNVHAFPSGVDASHFREARLYDGDFAEQVGLPRPRLGYAGVIDERIDMELIEAIALKRPEWHLIMIGPTVKIDPRTLPALPNIHWLGMKPYTDLPKYFAGWDVALMPFALNDSTRFISPTKTPEYLCAGLPVVSTPIRDVVSPYGEMDLVRIAKTPSQFIEACQQALDTHRDLEARERADQFLRSASWDSVWNGMNALINKELAASSPAFPVTATRSVLSV